MFIYKQFIPITKYEKELTDDLTFRYDIIKLFGMTAALLFKRFATNVISHFRKVDVTKNVVSGFFWAVTGFYLGQLFGVRMINEKTDFLKLRMKYEKEINFVRQKGELYPDYPFVGKEPYLKGDDEIKLLKFGKFKKIMRGN